jgi:hypothetical protein
MTVITIDQSVGEKLRNANGPVQFRDDRGVIAGEFRPATASSAPEANDSSSRGESNGCDDVETRSALRRAAERTMPRNAELMKLPDSPPPADWWDEESPF